MSKALNYKEIQDIFLQHGFRYTDPVGRAILDDLPELLSDLEITDKQLNSDNVFRLDDGIERIVRSFWQDVRFKVAEELEPVCDFLLMDSPFHAIKKQKKEVVDEF